MTGYLKTASLILTSIFIMQACQKHETGIAATLSVSPAVDTIGGIITITGTDFSPNPAQDTVQFNDSTFGQVLTASATQLTVVVPYYTAKDFIVVKANGREWQTTQAFQIAPKFTPPTEAPGYPITIFTGGSTTLSDYTVTFTGGTTTPTSLYGATMTVTIPGGTTTGKVTVNYKGQPFTSLTDLTIAPVGEVTNLTPTGSFQSTGSLVFDNSGHLYVSDVGAGYIDLVDPNSGVITPYAGDGISGFDGGSPLLSAGIYGARSLAFAPDGNLYAVDTWYGRIFTITADSVYLTLPIGGPAIDALNLPEGIVFDAAGNLYVGASQQIRMVTPGGVQSILAGNGLQGGADGPAASAGFYGPSALRFDASDILYICDGARVRTLSNGIVSTFAGGGGNGAFQDGVGTNAGFLSVYDMVIDPKTGNFYVTDPGDHVVRMITPGGVVTTIAGTIGQEGTQNGTGAAATFEGPGAIAMDQNGVLYVCDGSYGNSSIRKIVLHY